MFILKRLFSLIRPLINRFPIVSSISRCLRDQLVDMEKPIVTPWGFKLVGNSVMANGAFEPNETELTRELLKDSDVLVNVGANIGYYCCHALSMNKEVIAFEPITRNLRYLCRNIKSNDWTDAEIYPIALSNSIGILEIYGGGTGASILKGWAGTPESFMTYVPSSTLDIVLGDRLHGKKVLVLVDVEGAEFWMLEGAAMMLNIDPKPVWLVEITTDEHQPEDVGINPYFKDTFQLFFQNGYQAFNVDDELNPVTLEQIDQVLNGDFEFRSHNFLFKEYQ